MSGYLHTPDSGRPIQQDNPLPTETTSSKVEGPTVLFNSLAIRDTSIYYSPPMKSNGLPYKTIRVGNSLDQAIEIVLELSRDGGTTWQYGMQITASLVAASANVYGRSTASALTAPWPDWRIRIKSSTAPTSGSVEAWVIQHAN